MNLIQSFLTKNPCYTCGRTITPKGLMLHGMLPAFRRRVRPQLEQGQL